MEILGLIIDVSIHAPARGATLRKHKHSDRSGVSIHAPARGATANAFEPQINAVVSIHAPARGATFFRQIQRTEERFQSTHPRGVRLKRSIEEYKRDMFQSTHPRGVRQLFL